MMTAILRLLSARFSHSCYSCVEEEAVVKTSTLAWTSLFSGQRRAR